MWLLVTSSLAVTPHVRPDSKLSAFLQHSHHYGSVQLGDSAHHSHMEGDQQQDSAQQTAVGGCCKRGGHHLPGTDMPEGQLSNRQLKLKCLPKATLARGSPERKPQIREKILEIS